MTPGSAAMNALGLAIMCMLASTSASAEPRTRIMVYDLQSSAPLEKIAASLTDQILVTLGQDPDLKVIGLRELELLAEQGQNREALGLCREEGACLEAVQQAGDADRMITGHVGLFEEGYIVTLELFDVKHAAFLQGESCFGAKTEVFQCTGEAALRLLNSAPLDIKTASISASKIAILDLDALGVEVSLASSLTELLALELRKFEGLQVIQPDEVTAMLDYESQKQIAKCESDIECLRQIAGALGVDYLIHGGIGKLEDTFVVHLKLMDLERGEVIRRESESFRGYERHLPLALRFVAARLLGREVGGRGQLELEAGVDDALVSIDGGKPTPIAAFAGSSLSAGKHAISIHADGYLPFHRDTFVEDRILTRFDAALTPLPEAWYEKWWVWTIVGTAVAAAAVTTGVLVARDVPDTGSGTADIPFPGAAQ